MTKLCKCGRLLNHPGICIGRHLKPRIPFTCPICGKTDYLWPCKAKGRKYCGRECFGVLLRGHSQQKHYKLILEQTKILEEQGFRCVPITTVIPDIIAIRGNNVYAVEVESGHGGIFNRYENQPIKKYIDDVYWIILRSGSDGKG